jgi:chemotaxis protein MotB
LHELAPYLNSVPNRISLSGHTDTTAYTTVAGYTNWELSADRANAARRALEGGGLEADKTSRVVGLSSSVLFDKQNSRNSINRRISIIVMTKQAEDSALKSEARPQNVNGGVSVTEPAPATQSEPPAPPPSTAPPLRTTAPAPAVGTHAVATKIVDTAKPEAVPLTPASLPHGLPAPVAAADGAP